MKHGKKYVDGAKLVDRSNLYDSAEALDLAVKTATAKFDETIELTFAWALTPVTLISRCVALWCCPTAPVKPCA